MSTHINRPSKQELHMQIALLVATRSTCQRLQVGCVLSDPSHEIVTIGYNGTFKGNPNNTCFLDPSVPGGCGCVHAEMNAMAKAPRGPKVAYLTHAPCPICATLLVNADVVQVYYNDIYRSSDGLEVLRAAQIPHERLEV